MIMAATLGFTSCSTDDVETGGSVSGHQTLTLNITPASSLEANDTRATAYSDLTTGTENAINRVAVAVFDTNGKIQGSVSEKTQTTKASSISFEDTNVGNNYKVLVAVNCPAGTFSGVTSESAFKAKTLSVENALYQGGSGNKVSNNNLPMYGEATATQNGNKNEYTADVFAYHLVSKITLASLKVDIGSNTFTPTEIFVNNVPDKASVSVVAPHTSYIFATPNGRVTGETGSKAQSVLAYLSTGTLSTTNFKGTASNDVTTYNTASEMPVFYTTPNNLTAAGQGYATFLVIKGTYKDVVQNKTSTVYYPLYINYNTTTQKSADGYTAKTVNPNINYVMNVTIKMKGSDDPYTPVGDNTAIINVQAVDFDAKTTDYSYDNGIEIGDYLFNDGTTGKLPSTSQITTAHHPIAVIFANKTSKIDQARGFTKGYAIAIASTGSKLAWAKDGAALATAQVYTQARITSALAAGTAVKNNGATYSDYVSPFNTDASIAGVANVEQDLDGYTECLALKAAAGTNWNVTNYPAAYTAVENFKSVSGFALTGSWTNSGWYLGSIGQYYLVARNLGGNLANSLLHIDGSTSWYFSSISIANASAINKYLSVLPSSNPSGNTIAIRNTIDCSSSTGTSYYTSSEYKTDHGFFIRWYEGGALHLNGHEKKSSVMDDNRGVRPVIAF